MAIKFTRPCHLCISRLIRAHLSTLNVSERRLTMVAVLVLLMPLASGSSGAQQVPEEFSIESVAGSLDRDVVGFTFLPDGRILLIQKESGTVKLIIDGVVGPEPALAVDRLVPSSERGLLGIAVDPDFPDSNYIYLFHSRNDSTNRVTRFAAHGNHYRR